MIKKMFVLWLMLLSVWTAQANYQPRFSTAGFWEIPNSGREVFSMNPAWRFYKGDVQGGETPLLDDQSWGVVSLPHGIEYLPTEASGCINYQGSVWYRKHFTPESRLKGRKLFLHFEAIMGKSKVYVNGKLLAEHFGSYLPVVVDITEAVDWTKDNVIAVWADNSDDPNYPPGKAQGVLDFTYFGGIYRDCWLVAHDPVHITDPNYENEVAGGGLFVSFDKVTESSADVRLQLQVRNETPSKFTGKVEYTFYRPDGQTAMVVHKSLAVPGKKAVTVDKRVTLERPLLWSPENPQLYRLEVKVMDRKGKIRDGYAKRVGVRSVEFKGKDGFWLNGKPYESPLVGANRHQDFAVVGHAVPNSIHWCDAKKLRDAGLKVIRNAHCPQDPAFMDACDELGLFVIVNTPGWQFWNEKPIFEQRVYEDIRNLVRRDRNHACVWLWEPILNETWYPEDFAKNAKETVEQEYPHPYCYSACDASARGKDFFSVRFEHPQNCYKQRGGKTLDPNVTYFTREWGDNVDDWSSHNSRSRVARNWGEHAMLVQAGDYAQPAFDHTSYDALYRTTRQHVGGCLWHSFDHQRGYHPDPFYGGIMDAFRQPKYSYYMFQSQRSTQREDRLFETGPMVYIAHEMTPFSPADVTVYSNCEEVRLTYNKGGKSWTYDKPANQEGLPSPVITFKEVYDFMIDKNLSMYKGKGNEVFLLAEGLIGGKVVATHKVCPSRRPSKIVLWLDHENVNLKADGSDFVTVVAGVADANGNIKRLNNDYIKFSVEGEGRILGGADILANPAPVKWGTAPVLIQSTLNPGKIKVTASMWFKGAQKPVSGTLEFNSVQADVPLVYDVDEAARIPMETGKALSVAPAAENNVEQELKMQQRYQKHLQEVEVQQKDFGEKK